MAVTLRSFKKDKKRERETRERESAPHGAEQQKGSFFMAPLAVEELDWAECELAGKAFTIRSSSDERCEAIGCG